MYVRNFGYLPEIGYRLFPEKVALYQEGVQVTYAQIEARANRVANALLDFGARKGDRVALLLSNDVQYAEIFLGTMRGGAVAVPVNIRLGYESIRYLLADSGAQVLIASNDLQELAVRLVGDIAAVRLLVVGGAVHGHAVDYESWLSAASDERPALTTEPDDLCMMPYTSGSTGRPKGVLLHHAGQILNADLKRQIYMLTPEERTLVAGPLYHVNAMYGALLPFLIAGASAVILPRFDAPGVIRAIERYRCTHAAGTPAMYSLILREHEALARHDVSSIRFLTCGSAPVTPELLRGLQQTFGDVDVLEGYGLTEGGPIVTQSPRWGIRKLGSCGLPLPGVEVRLVAEEDAEIFGPAEVGELWVRSPGNARGYHGLPQVTRERFTLDGWLKTGDLMRRDADGFYYFLGRKDDMINVGGENVYPKEVETILLRHPALAEACVVPAPHPTKGNAPVAFVVPRSIDAPTEEDIRQFFLAHGPAYAHPRRVFFLDRMPLSGTGKVDRAALIERARAAMAMEETKGEWM